MLPHPPARVSLVETVLRNPFRLFFPLGILAGLFGVGHWALWTMGYAVGDIKNAHLILQSQGFLTFFVVGFLMTAFPRFSGTDPATPAEIALAFGGGLVFLAAASFRIWPLAHAATLVTLAAIPLLAGRRLSRGTKDLPPSFLLLGFGLLHAFLGVAVSFATNGGETHPNFYGAGRQMVQVGFLTCMVLGVTAKLAPFLMGYTAEPGCEEGGARFCLRRKTEIAAHGAAGALIFASFLLEPCAARAAFGLRAAVATAHLLLFAKIGRPLRQRTATMFFFWLSCWMIPAGFWTAFALPAYKVAALHIVFIGGFSLMIFSFGLLVVLSHSGKAALLNGKLWALRIVGAMTLVALGFRLAADFAPARYMLFLHNASGFWVAAAAVWLIYAVPKMRGVHHEH